MPNPADKLIDLMTGVNQLIRHNTKCHHDANPLSIIQLRTLIFINREKRATMKAIADYLGVTAPTATVMINNLERVGFIKRQADKSDRRLIHIILSTRGKKKAADTLEQLKKKINLLFGQLTASEQKQFIKLLEKILTVKN